MTSYHHFGDFVGSAPFDIYFQVGSEGEVLLASDVIPSFSSASVTTVSHQFTTDGTESVFLRLHASTSPFRTAVINGFMLTLVPEPASGLLLALGTAILVISGSWRRLLRSQKRA